MSEYFAPYNRPKSKTSLPSPRARRVSWVTPFLRVTLSQLSSRIGPRETLPFHFTQEHFTKLKARDMRWYMHAVDWSDSR
jgi:hypothetical protein